MFIAPFVGVRLVFVTDRDARHKFDKQRFEYLVGIGYHDLSILKEVDHLQRP